MKKITSMGFGLLATSLLLSAFSPLDNKANQGQSFGYKSDTQSQQQRPLGAPIKDCNDVELMDNDDEQDMYNTYGYTRGDIYYIYRYKFDPNTMTDIDGKIARVLRVKYPDGDCYLVLIVATSNGNNFLVNVGQVGYLDEKRFTLEEGQSVQLSGSKIRLNGRHIIIATKITRDGEAVELRNDQGQGNWKRGMSGMFKKEEQTSQPQSQSQFSQRQMQSNQGSSFKPNSNY